MKKNVVLSKFNIGVVGMIFFIIYILWIIFSYANKNNIYSYEVRQGSLAKANNYTGVAIRQEEIITAESSGFIRYFAREGEHVGIGDLVYTIDASGVMNDMISSKTGGDNAISDSDLSQIKNEISNFCSYYDDTEFSKTYDFLYSMEGMVLKFANMSVLEEINKANAESDSVKLCKAEKTGYVVYNIDGYESLSVNGINSEIFNKDEYEKTQLINTSLIDAGAEAYKIVTSEKWSIAISLDESRANELVNEGYVKVRFLEDQRELSAKIEVFQLADDYFGVLSFNSSVLAYCTERYIDIEIITQEETGLKIPVTSIVYKEFYLVPEDYMIEEGENNTVVFARKVFREDGTVTSERLTLEVYAQDNGYYYIDDSALGIGDYLLKLTNVNNVQQTTNTSSSDTYEDDNENFEGAGEEGENDEIVPDRLVLPEEDTTPQNTTTSEQGFEEYAVATKGELCGVYNMNMGYADFRRINILYENEEYAIVASNSAYGLREYDFIVLDAIAVSDGDYTYE